MNNTAYETALRIILLRPHVEQELIDKLRKKEFGTEEIDETLIQLRAQKYINDTKLAADFVRHHLEYKPMGKRGIRQRMLIRRFKPADIEQALRSVTPEDELAACQRLLESRASRPSIIALPPAERRDKLARFLLSRGFDSELVLRVLQKSTVGAPVTPD